VVFVLLFILFFNTVIRNRFDAVIGAATKGREGGDGKSMLGISSDPAKTEKDIMNLIQRCHQHSDQIFTLAQKGQLERPSLDTERDNFIQLLRDKGGYEDSIQDLVDVVESSTSADLSQGNGWTAKEIIYRTLYEVLKGEQ
jgi:hypothetical protein